MKPINRRVPLLLALGAALGVTACFHSDDDKPTVPPVEFANVLFELETMAGEVLRDTTRIAMMAEDIANLCDDGGSAEYTEINQSDYRLSFHQCATRDFSNSRNAERLVLNGGFRVSEDEAIGQPSVWTINAGAGSDAFFLNYQDQKLVSYTLQLGYLFAEEPVQGYAMTIPEVIIERRENTPDGPNQWMRHTLVVRMPQVVSDVGDADSVLQPIVWGFEGTGMRERQLGGCPSVGFGITTTSRTAGISAEYEMTLHNTDAQVSRIAGSMSVETEHGDSAGYTDGDLPTLCR